jgi:hypothetical protein
VTEWDNVYRATSSRRVGVGPQRTAVLAALWLIAGGCTAEVSEHEQKLFAGRTALMSSEVVGPGGCSRSLQRPGYVEPMIKLL